MDYSPTLRRARPAREHSSSRAAIYTARFRAAFAFRGAGFFNIKHIYARRKITMKTRAAVAWEKAKPLQITEID